jgi:nucleoside-diphosphate kinase
MSNKTFTIIKPDAVKKGHIGKILDHIVKAGFRVVALKYTQITADLASSFYKEHEGKAFFDTLIQFMSSGPVYVAILEKDNAIQDFRSLIGNTNPENAESHTIRAKYASNMQQNAIHGSDSDESAEREGKFFFSHLERF